MNEAVTTIFGLAGGLAMFLFGMNSMSDALQKAAGEKMKKILGFLTRNPLMGALAGALVTAVLQSSSATTVMAIGFVSAGLMTLPQAISVIFGANIGTTMTAQLMAFQITDYIYPIIFIGFMIYFVGKKERVTNIGMVIFSFGLLFEGIEIMGSVMKPLANSQVFIDLMGKVTDFPALGIALGAVMTLVVQSSSATIAVLQNFASQAGPDGVTSVMGLMGAIPILLGDNIGTTITALLASIGQSRSAKRTAISHSIFNISGSIVFAFLLRPFAALVTFLSPSGNEVDVIARQIANAHTTFNIVCTLVWLPLIPLMVRIVTTIIPGEDTGEREAFRPRFLDNNIIDQPVPAMYVISQEISRCADFAASMLVAARAALNGQESETGSFDELHETVKKLEGSIAAYITRLFARGVLTEAQSEQTAGLLYIANSIERIADRSEEVTQQVRELQHSERNLSGTAYRDLEKCYIVASNMLQRAIEAVKNGDTALAQKVLQSRNKMRKAQKRFLKAHLSRVKEGKCDAALTEVYSNILYGLDRMADSCTGIAEEALEHSVFVTLEEAAPADAPPDAARISAQPQL